jgi:hypothetical protein
LRKLVNEGQQVSSGTAYSKPMVQARKWILRSGVTDKQWAAINIGDRAEIGIGSAGDRMFMVK